MAKLQDAAKQAAQQQTPQQQVSDQPAAQIPTAPDANQSLAVPSAPALKEIPDAAVPPMPTAISSNEPAPPAIPASENKLQDRSGPARVPSAQDVMLKTPSAPTVVADEAKSAVAAAATADLSDLNDKMDKILNRLGSLESEMAALKSSKPDNGAQIDVLKDSVASLEKKITSLSEERQKNRSSSQQNSVPVAQPAMRMTDPAPAPDAKPAPQILGAPDADIPPVTSPRMTKRLPVAKSPKTASVQWVLKGAQPDHAIVARAGENDMKTVAVGDSLPGIGQIQAISYQNGRWVVVGTQGRINQ